jgi:uncharacterized RDD family membrane protein YckC
MRFDEVELQPVPMPDAIDALAPREPSPVPLSSDASRFRRLLALFTDLSLFVAFALALSPLLPTRTDWIAVSGLLGFVMITSFYYFVGSWLLWGKTIGGAIFDVRVVASADEAMSFHSAAIRWAGMFVSILTAGIGFAFAAFPGRLSLPDRLSGTRCIATH